jgi:L-fuconolactonase
LSGPLAGKKIVTERDQAEPLALEPDEAQRIDAHHHLWRYSAAEYGWIDDSMGALRRDFLPKNLVPELKEGGIHGVVSVQARQTLEETRWLLEMAESQVDGEVWIRGIVGWAPLIDPDLQATLDELLQHRLLKGLRHVLQAEPDDYMLNADFNRGISAMGTAGLVYDILVLENMLPQVIELVDRHPNQVFVLDHMAKPRIAAGMLEPWATNLCELARREHVYCKLSGLTTEANWQSWSSDELGAYVDVALQAFGPSRLLAGSDWPVCTLATSYKRWFATLHQMLSTLSTSEKNRIFGGTAIEVYRLNVPHSVSATNRRFKDLKEQG